MRALMSIADAGNRYFCRCAERFSLTNAVHCEGERVLHWLCKPCFNQYCTITLQKGSSVSIPCAIPNCESLYSAASARSGLGALDLLCMEEREAARNQRVALAAKAVLRCVCGEVGVVMEEDIGNGIVSCPFASLKAALTAVLSHDLLRCVVSTLTYRAYLPPSCACAVACSRHARWGTSTTRPPPPVVVTL